MSSGFFNDPIGSVFGTVNSLINGVVSNPVGTIVDAFLISNGIDPATAGAIAGATNSASKGGNIQTILSSAAIGGAAGYAGGSVGTSTGSSVAGAAAGGATAALLSGQNPITGAFSGALAGAITSKVVNSRYNSTTYTFDDGSTLSYNNSSGQILGGTDSSGTTIPSAVINAANSGALVQTATPVAAADAQAITNTVQQMQSQNATPAEMAMKLSSMGYDANQVISTLGGNNPDVVTAINNAYSQASQNYNAITNTITTLQGQGATNAQIAQALAKQGFNATDVTYITGSTTQDQVNQAFSDAANLTATGNVTSNTTGNVSGPVQC